MTQLDGELPLELEIRKSWMSEWADWSKEACLIRVRSVFKKQHHSVNVLLHWLHTTGSNVATAKWVMGHSLKLCSLSLVLFEIRRQIIKLLVCEEMCSCNDPHSNAMQLFIYFLNLLFISHIHLPNVHPPCIPEFCPAKHQVWCFSMLYLNSQMVDCMFILMKEAIVSVHIHNNINISA